MAEVPLQATVAQLFCYPLKSAAGLALRQAGLDRFGLEGDRRWMLVDEQGGFVTQRRCPRLCLVRAEVADDHIRFSLSEAADSALPPLQVLRPRAGAPIRSATVWKDTCEAQDAGEEAAAWFSRYLGSPVRLVYMPDSLHRQVNLKYAREGDSVSFADGFPLLLANQGSLDELNRRMGQSFSMLRFRPNIVISGPAPFEEDRWRRIRINGIVFEVSKPCERCVVTTVDPDTGERGKEPLATLSGFRRINNKVLFGQNLIHRGQGSLAVGDRVEILA